MIYVYYTPTDADYIYFVLSGIESAFAFWVMWNGVKNGDL